ncbi:MAG: insulinase family protein [Trueperaceae bacterium]|nr:MAG: insulinase family protein [Trueperaceae bacterium]
MPTHGFELLRDEAIAELNGLARVYEHVKSGARLLSIENEDENKVFGITFRTPPSDSTGLPHILEHSVLCGSRKYPLKEPFVELLKGSLKTFLNAFTSPDATSYPVASQNQKDLYNLVDVYLDAVFYPRLTPAILEQEGWHFELDDPSEPLRFKGVVYNEMKGAYSSPHALLGRYSQRSLFPDTPYGLDSGGDPAEIPNLSFEQFKAFHQTLYHPSNALLYFYGDDDPQERLRYLDTVLQAFERREVDSQLPLQAHFDEPRRLRFPYDAGAEGRNGNAAKEQKGLVSVNWLLTERTDTEHTLGLEILGHILVGTPASPLRKALLDSGLGEDLTGGGVSSSLRQLYFSTGLSGIAVSDSEKVEKLILDTLTSLAKDGLDPDTVAASLNTIEFVLRENNTGSFPRGLLLMLRAFSSWLHDGDPLEPLAFEAPLEAIKDRLASGEPYFEGLVREYLVNAFHRTTVVLEPDPEVRQRQENEERSRLDQARSGMSDREVQAVIDNTRELRRRQEAPDPPEALARIPSLELADLDREGKRLPLDVLQGGQVLHHDLFTGGIVYLDVGFDLHVLPQELIPYLPMFAQALLKMGTKSADYVKLSQRIGSKTGGISPSLFTTAQLYDSESVARFLVRGKATVEQADDLLDLLRELLCEVVFDNPERFKQLVLEARSRRERRLVPAGTQVVATRLGAHFGESGWLSEQLEGVSQLFFLRRLEKDVDGDWPAVLAKLEELRRRLIDRDALICNVTVDGAAWARLEPKVTSFLDALPASGGETLSWSPPKPVPFEGLTIPARVNYVAKGANLYEHGYRLHGSVAVVTNLLRLRWLWDRVRVQGGAYGAYCAFDHRSGVFTYASYRDPNLLATLETFDRSARFLRELELSERERVRGIIGAIGQIDRHQLPDAKGFTSMVRHLVGEGEAERQRRREEVLGTTTADIRAFAEVLEHVATGGKVAVMGSREAIDEADGGRGWLEVTGVL